MSDTFVKNTGIYKVLPIGGNNCVINSGQTDLYQMEQAVKKNSCT